MQTPKRKKVLGAPAIPQIYAYAQELATESRSDDKTFAMSALRSLISLGFLIGPLGGAFIFGYFGYKGLFTGTSFIYLVIASLIFFFLKRRAIRNNTGKRKSIVNSSLKNRRIWQPFIAFIFLLIVNFINGIVYCE